jgi:ribosomal protein S18 acetylase RimI-like enzyme
VSSPVIRRATEEDSPAILDCLRAAFEPYRDQYTHGAFTDTVLTAESIRQRLAHMRVFVAISDSNELVGTIGCGVLDTGEGHIRGMAVRPAWHGSGVAGQLLKSAESELRQEKCARIRLDTTGPLQQAVRFYEKHGFRASGRVSDFFGMPLFEYLKETP